MAMKVVFLVTCLFAMVTGHGYLKVPPARNCMWRFNFPNPANYNDNQCYCGGATTMNRRNKGRCGVCGDAAHHPHPPHADGGRYSNGIIGRTYKKGQSIEIQVLLTASHKGHFEFRIGDFTNKITSGDSVGKLNGYLLKTTSGENKYPVRGWGHQTIRVRLQLPADLTCDRCVLQWWYRGGNSWGCDKRGCGLGYGGQEHFVNCADVKIV